MKRLLPLITLISIIWCNPIFAHKNSDSYLRLSIDNQTIIGQWDVALRDLNLVLPLDNNNNREITWGEITNNKLTINQALSKFIKFKTNNEQCDTRIGSRSIVQYGDGTYIHNTFTSHCTATIENLNIEYNFLFEYDAQHRVLVTTTHKNKTQTRIISDGSRAVTIELSLHSYWNTIFEYLTQGVWHILIGYDHILFLVVLLVPFAAARNHNKSKHNHVIKESLKIITAFTIAHSITLALSVFNWLTFSSQWVESLIAASIILAAANNIFPIIKRNIWPLVFVFGLIHGFGFATVLTELGLPASQKGLALLSFNIGVEIGQLAIVALALPLIVSVKNIMRQPLFFVRAGSMISISLATVWLVEQVFAVTVYPG